MDARIVDRDATIKGLRRRDVDEPFEFLLETNLATETILGAAFISKRRHRDPPALIEAADDIFDRDLDIVEEGLVELVLARDLPQGPDRDARTAHVDEEETQPLMLRKVAVGADKCEAPLRILRKARPYLLAIDDELVTPEIGAGAHRSKIRA